MNFKRLSIEGFIRFLVSTVAAGLFIIGTSTALAANAHSHQMAPSVAGGRKLHRYGGRKLHTAIWELRDPSWSGPCTRGSIECCYATTSSRG